MLDAKTKGQIQASKRDTMEYLQGVIGEIRTMAQAQREPMIAYLIEMAYVEISDRMREIHEQSKDIA